MPIVNEIMSVAVQVITPEATLRQAARMMLELDVGALPVCRDVTLLGMVTDRDIAVRGVAAGLMPDIACVSEVMTTTLEFCTEDQDTEEVMRTMGQAQVRRLPVGEHGRGTGGHRLPRRHGATPAGSHRPDSPGDLEAEQLTVG